MGEYFTCPLVLRRRSLTWCCRTGYANHGDYLFGWKDDALQRAIDNPCYINCPTLKTQDVAAMNKCTVDRVVKEEIDACK